MSERELAERMAEAAGALLDALGPEQRASAARPFDAEGERVEWYYTPSSRPGLSLAAMDPAQQRRVHQLLVAGLSERGYNTAATIMGLENVLDVREGWRFPGYPGDGGRSRDPNGYFVAIFGEPGGRDPWSWSFGGHHVSVHHTIADGRVAASSPLFMGANPAEAELAGGYPLRPLAGAEDLALELYHQLDDERQARARLSPVAPDDIVTSNRSRVAAGDTPLPTWRIMQHQPTADQRERVERRFHTFREQLGVTDEVLASLALTDEPLGLPASAMTGAQRDALAGLVRHYFDRLPEPVAEALGSRVIAALDEMHLAWAGGAQRGEPHYYRLQGPRFLVEYDNVQNGANHIHTVWRDPQGDFGYDILAAHYAQAH